MTTAAPPRNRGRDRMAVALWLAAIAAALVVAWRAHYVADLSAFLPSAPTPEQAVLLDQLRSGATSRLVLIGIEGGPVGGDPDAAAAARAQASSRLAAALRASGRFASVHNGETSAWADAGKFVFAHRYLLSPAVDAERFSVAGLRDAIEQTVGLLGTPAGTLLKPILFRDPTGETLRIAEALTPARAPKVEHGVWVSRSAPRAVLVATTLADGADLDGQERALDAIDAASTAASARCWPSMSAPSATVVATSTARGALRETQTPCSTFGARVGVRASAMRSVSPVGSRNKIGFSSVPAGVPSSATVDSIASRRPAAVKCAASTAGLSR